MTGGYLAQLQAGVVGLLADLNDALEDAALAPLRDLLATQPEKAAGRPLGRVTLAGDRRLDRRFVGDGHQETVPVRVELLLDVDEPTALAYSGVLTAVLAAATSDLATAVTDATLTRWRLLTAGGEADSGRKNNSAWRVWVTAEALLQW